MEEDEEDTLRTERIEMIPRNPITLPLFYLFLGCIAGYLGAGRVLEVHRHTLVLQGVDYAYWQEAQGVSQSDAVNALLNAWDD